MNLIVAVDKNWAIGMDNKLLVSIPQDMKFFRETTKGKVVAMGRKTLESFPGGQPLKNRVNVVLTSDKKYNVKGTVVVHSIDEMVEELKKYNDEDIFVIGERAFTDSFCHTVRRHILQRLITLTRRIHFSRIWIRTHSGR